MRIFRARIFLSLFAGKSDKLNSSHPNKHVKREPKYFKSYVRIY